MKAVVAAFNQEKALVGAFSVITNLRMELFQALLEGGGGERREQSSCPALVIDTDSRLEAGGWPRLAQAARCCTSSGPCVRVATGHGAVTLDRWADPLQIQLQTSAANYNITTCCQAPTKMAQHFPIGAGNTLQTCIRLILMIGCYVV